MVEVLLALEDVGAVALLKGLLLAEAVEVVPTLGRSRAEALGGLRVDVEGFLGGMLPFNGGLEEVEARGFSGDLSLSVPLGFEDGVDTRGAGCSTGAMTGCASTLTTLCYHSANRLNSILV